MTTRNTHSMTCRAVRTRLAFDEHAVAGAVARDATLAALRAKMSNRTRTLFDGARVANLTQPVSVQPRVEELHNFLPWQGGPTGGLRRCRAAATAG